MDNLTLHLKQLGKEKKEKLQNQQRKGIIKTQAEINEKEMKETILKINKSKNRVLEKINKIDKPLTRLIKKIRKKNQINKIRNEKGEVTTENEEIQRIMSLL